MDQPEHKYNFLDIKIIFKIAFLERITRLVNEYHFEYSATKSI